MERLSFPELYMQFAELIATRSTCGRLQVGAVITSADFRKVVGIGYNGNASGLPNTCDSEEPGKCGCLHAEENAIINSDTPRETPKIAFITHMPCPMCAKRLINLGSVQKVYYRKDYRSRDSVGILEGAGIEVEQLSAPTNEALWETQHAVQ
ncbi:MAG: deaminase [FCB group bacterium]|jgi:dCMP deaminase|nr:deaminase [FCB group bacterium]